MDLVNLYFCCSTIQTKNPFWIMHPTKYLPSWVRYPKEIKSYGTLCICMVALKYQQCHKLALVWTHSYRCVCEEKKI